MIRFFQEDVTFVVPQPLLTKRWLKSVIEEEGYRLNALNYILCSDEYLHRMNVEYLQHDTLTDVITFDQAEVEGEVAGDIYISVDRVRDNAAQFGVSPAQELSRVMVHGALHLMGYLDKSEADVRLMREKEDHYLQVRFGN
jgi:probable rRNA maturation factor